MNYFESRPQILPGIDLPSGAEICKVVVVEAGYPVGAPIADLKTGELYERTIQGGGGRNMYPKSQIEAEVIEHTAEMAKVELRTYNVNKEGKRIGKVTKAHIRLPNGAHHLIRGGSKTKGTEIRHDNGIRQEFSRLEVI